MTECSLQASHLRPAQVHLRETHPCQAGELLRGPPVICQLCPVSSTLSCVLDTVLCHPHCPVSSTLFCVLCPRHCPVSWTLSCVLDSPVSCVLDTFLSQEQSLLCPRQSCVLCPGHCPVSWTVLCPGHCPGQSATCPLFRSQVNLISDSICPVFTIIFLAIFSLNFGSNFWRCMSSILI
jgi:hypothetical protein